MAEKMKGHHLNGRCPFCEGHLLMIASDRIYQMREAVECSDCGRNISYAIKNDAKDNIAPKP